MVPRVLWPGYLKKYCYGVLAGHKAGREQLSPGGGIGTRKSRMEMTRATSIGFSRGLIMQIDTAIKWGHRTLTLVLIIIVITVGMLWYFENAPRDDRLISQKQLSEDVWLYITQYQDAGATDSDTYRYYLNKQLNNPMKVITKTLLFFRLILPMQT